VKAEIDSGELAAEPGRVTLRPKHRSRYLALLGIVVVAVIVGTFAVRSLLRATSPRESGGKLTTIGTDPVTFSAGPEYGGNLSPNSEFLVYSHTKHGTMDLYVQPRVGGRTLRLTDGAGDELNPRWSRDGTQIAYVGGSGTNADIFTISPLGGPSTKLAETGIPHIHSFWDVVECLGSKPWSLNDEGLLFARRLDSGDVAT